MNERFGFALVRSVTSTEPTSSSAIILMAVYTFSPGPTEWPAPRNDTRH